MLDAVLSEEQRKLRFRKSNLIRSESETRPELETRMDQPEAEVISGVNFINIKRANFSYETLFWQLFSSYMYVKNDVRTKKFVHLILMKLTIDQSEIPRKKIRRKKSETNCSNRKLKVKPKLSSTK